MSKECCTRLRVLDSTLGSKTGGLVWLALSVVTFACAADPAPQGAAVERTSQALTADTVIVPAVADTMVARSYPVSNFGALEVLDVAAVGSERRATLVAFDAEAVAAALGERELSAASLTFSIEQGMADAEGVSLTVHRLMRPFSEGGATWWCADDSDHGYWGRFMNNCAPEDRWSLGEWHVWPAPHAEQASDEVPFVDAPGILSFDVTEDVTRMLTGSAPFHGFIVQVRGEADGWLRMSSREGGDGPRLVLTPEEPGCVPSAEVDLCDGIDEDCDGEIDEDCVSVGSPCSSNEDCAALGPRAICDISSPGGYCSIPCTASPSCPSGTFCFQEAICVVSCLPDRTCEDPRLSCGTLMSMPDEYCRASCEHDTCPEGMMCDAANDLCLPG